MEKQLIEALEYAYDLLKDQADKGYYPEKALAEFGGKGFEPIETALKTCDGENDRAGESNCTTHGIMPRFYKLKYTLEQIDDYVDTLYNDFKNNRGMLGDIQKLIRWRKKYDKLNGL